MLASRSLSMSLMSYGSGALRYGGSGLPVEIALEMMARRVVVLLEVNSRVAMSFLASLSQEASGAGRTPSEGVSSRRSLKAVVTKEIMAVKRRMLVIISGSGKFSEEGEGGGINGLPGVIE